MSDVRKWHSCIIQAYSTVRTSSDRNVLPPCEGWAVEHTDLGIVMRKVILCLLGFDEVVAYSLCEMDNV